MAGVALLLSTLFALALANSPWSDTYLAFWNVPCTFRIGDFAVSKSLKQWISDGLMTLFFSS